MHDERTATWAPFNILWNTSPVINILILSLVNYAMEHLASHMWSNLSPSLSLYLK